MAADFPCLGITIAGIRSFIDANGGQSEFREKSTNDVCDRFLKPTTAKTALSYCQQHESAYEIGIATVFVSHAWCCNFLTVVAAMERWAMKNGTNTLFWFDIFSNPQHKTGEKDFSWWCGCFKDNIGRIGHTLLVLQWETPIPLSRAWCVFELACTVTTNSALEIIMNEEEAEAFEQALLADVTPISVKLCNVDVEEAKASHAGDLANIQQAIRLTIGYHQCNTRVTAALREWMAQQALSTLASQADRSSIGAIRLQIRAGRLLVDGTRMRSGC